MHDMCGYLYVEHKYATMSIQFILLIELTRFVHYARVNIVRSWWWGVVILLLSVGGVRHKSPMCLPGKYGRFYEEHAAIV